LIPFNSLQLNLGVDDLNLKMSMIPSNLDEKILKKMLKELPF
jgi:hypothetical protein